MNGDQRKRKELIASPGREIEEWTSSHKFERVSTSPPWGVVQTLFLPSLGRDPKSSLLSVVQLSLEVLYRDDNGKRRGKN